MRRVTFATPAGLCINSFTSPGLAEVPFPRRPSGRSGLTSSPPARLEPVPTWAELKRKALCQAQAGAP